MTINGVTKTVMNVASAVRRQFGDESGVQITDADIIRWVNDGQKEINLKNRVLKGRAVVNAVNLQADYTLPEVDIAVIESIHYNGIPLAAIPYPEAEGYIKNIPDSALASGTPTAWYEWGGVVTFYPAPNGVTTGQIALLYTKNPTAVTALSDALSLPDKYFNTLVQYALAQAYEMDEDWEASNFKTQQLEKGLDTAADDERTTSSMTYPTLNVMVEY